MCLVLPFVSIYWTLSSVTCFFHWTVCSWHASVLEHVELAHLFELLEGVALKNIPLCIYPVSCWQTFKVFPIFVTTSSATSTPSSTVLCTCSSILGVRLLSYEICNLSFQWTEGCRDLRSHQWMRIPCSTALTTPEYYWVLNILSISWVWGGISLRF